MERKTNDKPKTLDPKTCAGPLIENCALCTTAPACLPKHFTANPHTEALYARVHQYVTAFYMPKLYEANRAKAWMFYCYLNNIAGRSEKARAEGLYGVAFAKLERIERDARMRPEQVKRYTKVLEGRERGLEDVRLIRRVRMPYRGTYKHGVRWELLAYLEEERLCRLVADLHVAEPVNMEELHIVRPGDPEWPSGRGVPKPVGRRIIK